MPSRKRQIEAFAGDDDAMSALPSNDPDPVEMHLARLQLKALAAFAQLPEDKRRLIMLAYLRTAAATICRYGWAFPPTPSKTHLRRALAGARATMFASIEARRTARRKTKRATSRPPSSLSKWCVA